MAIVTKNMRAKDARVRKAVRLTFTHLFLIFFSLLMLMPFVWMVLSSFKSDAQILSIPIKWLPTEWHFENYIETWKIAPWGTYFTNTILVTVLSIIGQLIVASMGAYAFARLNFRGRNVMFIIYLSTMMLPFQVTMIPMFKIIKTLGWMDSLTALIVPNFFSVFGVFMLRQFFFAIPSELEDAAKIDGCNYLMCYWEIVMKNSKPALVTLTLFIFMGTWNEFLRPLLFLNEKELWTLSLGLSKFKGQYTSMWSSMMCGAVISIMPIMIVFLFAQKYFIEGMVMSGIKG